MLVPSSALKVLSEFGQVMSEHRTYVASFGLFMAAGTGLSRLAGLAAQARLGLRATVSAAAFAAVLVVLTALSISRNRIWANSVSLWTDAVEEAPQTWLPLQGLAEAHREAGECQAAIEPYRRAIELVPGKAESYLGLAWCLLDLGRPAEAAETLRLGIDHAPENAPLRLQLAVVEERYFRDRGEALRLCQSALALAPELAAARDCVQRNAGGRPDPRR